MNIYYILLILLIILAIASLWLIKNETDKKKEIRESHGVIHESQIDKSPILLFFQFLEKEINDFYESLTSNKEIVKETETLLGESKLGSSIFPAEIGASITQTIEKKIKPTPQLKKYAYIVSKLSDDNKITIIAANDPNNTEMARFERILTELKDFDIVLTEDVIEKTKTKIRYRNTIDKLLKDRISKYEKLNCLILNFPFTVKKVESGYELVSKKDQTHEISVTVRLNNTSLTDIGKSHFESMTDRSLSFSIFGFAQMNESNGEEYISITSLAVF